MKRRWSLLLLVVILMTGSALPVAARGQPAPGCPGTDEVISYLKLCRTVREQYRDRCGWLWPAPAPPAVSPVARRAPDASQIKGLYITYYGLGSKLLRDRVKELLETTELNAVVMDLKGDRGRLAFPTQVELAQEIKADEKPMIQDPAEFLAWFQKQEIYTIARIVVFKDEPLAVAHPEWAVKDAETAEIWRDGEGLGWVDPSRVEVWDYAIALTVEAAALGFDEIQFDYVRFPTDGVISRATFAVENTQENRVQAITGFLAWAQEALKPYDVRLAADVFGYTTWRQDDMGIGQQIEAMAPYLDVISPMLYPSTFADGLPGTTDFNPAIAYPYDIVYRSTARAVARVQAVNPAIVVRPWIQDFPDYAFDGRAYTAEDVRLQMTAAIDAGAQGWMLWDPRVKYTPDALDPAEAPVPP